MLSRATVATGFDFQEDAYQLVRPVAGGDVGEDSFCWVGVVVEEVASAPCPCICALVDACGLSSSGFGFDFLRLGPIFTATSERANADL
jgi:hypothetical protein